MTTTRAGHVVRLIVIVGLAFVVRSWGWNEVGLDHFDEGGYAMSAVAVAESSFETDRYPLQHFLSPPFQFGTAGLAMRVFGTSDTVLIGLSALMGLATVVLTYVFALRWFGPAAAVASGLVVALADFHVLYSRSGLTDVSFGFWFLLAVVLFSEAEDRKSWVWAIAAGLAMGVAWNTKYHGWLAAGVAGVGLLPSMLEDRRIPWRGIGRIALASAVAGLMYLPWAQFIMAQPGGYARLGEEHALYLWPTRALVHLWTHLEVQLYLDGWWGRLAPGAAALWIAWTTGAAGKSAALRRGAAVLAVGVAVGSTVAVGLAAIVGLVQTALKPRAGVRNTIALFLVFSALTPLYSPFPRLILPWLLGAYLLAGAGLVRIVRGPDAEADPMTAFLRWVPAIKPVGVAATVAIVAVALVLRPPWQSAESYRAKDGFRTAARQIASDIPSGARVLVWGEPGVTHYLRGEGIDAEHVDGIAPLGEAVAEGGDVFLVTSIYAGLYGVENERSRLIPDVELTERSSAPVRSVSDVRLLDDLDLDEARAFLGGQADDYDLRLFSAHR